MCVNSRPRRSHGVHRFAVTDHLFVTERATLADGDSLPHRRTVTFADRIAPAVSPHERPGALGLGARTLDRPAPRVDAARLRQGTWRLRQSPDVRGQVP
ncbi:hypothetical protein [Actinoallomurus soli]|uniref:hypothetical protein n=1 Tax=Actinoallomurus soli TaxID=2952535 RepID=UPI002093510E|nr:hypothetical protein [Actinoallomurus soli]MCO5968796.1 hypothetical protein [Actinoallomurus soli]